MIRTTKTHEIIEHMLDALERPNRDLTEWEDNFLASIKHQYAFKSDLSDKQFEILERIYAEKTA